METSKSLQVMDPMVPGRDLTAYIASVNSIAVLTPEQEKELANQYYYDDNVDAPDSWCFRIYASWCIWRNLIPVTVCPLAT